jgi:hypothetical protein
LTAIHNRKLTVCFTNWDTTLQLGPLAKFRVDFYPR